MDVSTITQNKKTPLQVLPDCYRLFEVKDSEEWLARYALLLDEVVASCLGI